MVRFAVASAALCVFIVPTGARAGVVDASDTELRYRASPGERNAITVLSNGGHYVVRDAAGATPGAGCDRDSSGDVVCGNDFLITRISIDAGDGDDRVTVHALSRQPTVAIAGAAGDDVLAGAPNAPNTFSGGSGRDEMTGGAFADVFDEGPARNGSDTMRAGVADPRSVVVDVVDYGGRRRPVQVDLAGDRDDGERRERDLIATDVDAVTGGRGRDALIGNGARNGLRGGPGADLLRGGAGSDYVEGGDGADALAGGAGPDVVVAGGGPDRIDERDRAIDAILCGRGGDRVRQDRIDFHRGCERAGPSVTYAVPFGMDASLGFRGPDQLRVAVGCPGRPRRCVGTVAVSQAAARASGPFDLSRGCGPVALEWPGPLDPVREEPRRDRGMRIVVTSRDSGGRLRTLRVRGPAVADSVPGC